MKTDPISRPRALLLLPAFLAACLLMSGCGILPTEEDILPPPLITPGVVQYKTQAVAVGDIALEIRLIGQIRPRAQAALSFESQGGRLLAVHVRLGQSVAKGDALAELDPGTLDDQILIQDIELQKMQLVYKQLKSGGADAISLQLQDLSIRQQRIRLAGLKTQREAMVIRSPIDGVVTYVGSTQVGEYVNAYQSMVRVADPRDLLLYTTDDKASDLPIGAEVTLEFKKAQYKGSVVANPSTMYDDPDESLREAAILSFTDGLPEDAKMGDSVRIVHLKDHREGVIVLPRSLVHLMAGRRYVNVLEDGVRVEKDVELGLMTDTDAEIVKGLEVGDLVILG